MNEPSETESPSQVNFENFPQLEKYFKKEDLVGAVSFEMPEIVLDSFSSAIPTGFDGWLYQYRGIKGSVFLITSASVADLFTSWVSAQPDVSIDAKTKPQANLIRESYELAVSEKMIRISLTRDFESCEVDIIEKDVRKKSRVKWGWAAALELSKIILQLLTQILNFLP